MSRSTPDDREATGGALARDLLREGLARREAPERRQQLAADHAAGRRDARGLLEDLEAGQLDLIDDEDA